VEKDHLRNEDIRKNLQNSSVCVFKSVISSAGCRDKLKKIRCHNTHLIHLVYVRFNTHLL
jgi:hypothetical protein